MPRIIRALLPSLIFLLTFGTVLTGCAGLAADQPPACVSVAAPPSVSDRAAVRIELVEGDRVASAVLDDSAPARELLGLLPLRVELRDSFGLAMVASIPAALDTGGAPVSCDFVVGEIGYSPADGGIAIFHSVEAAQLQTPAAVRLGRVTSGLTAITDHGSVRVTIRRAG
ncbi:MAG TPA: cyclophilin-like fold protein [Propionicimonas sp.]|jgi:hypothetical protein